MIPGLSYSWEGLTGGECESSARIMRVEGMKINKNDIAMECRTQLMRGGRITSEPARQTTCTRVYS